MYFRYITGKSINPDKLYMKKVGILETIVAVATYQGVMNWLKFSQGRYMIFPFFTYLF